MRSGGNEVYENLQFKTKLIFNIDLWLKPIFKKKRVLILFLFCIIQNGLYCYLFNSIRA